jgi:hypothetical protein
MHCQRNPAKQIDATMTAMIRAILIDATEAAEFVLVTTGETVGVGIAVKAVVEREDMINGKGGKEVLKDNAIAIRHAKLESGRPDNLACPFAKYAQ